MFVHDCGGEARRIKLVFTRTRVQLCGCRGALAQKVLQVHATMAQILKHVHYMHLHYMQGMHLMYDI